MEYRVRWEIDIEADSPLEAALEAERHQLMQIQHETYGASRGCFEVIDSSIGRTVTLVDLADTEESHIGG